MNAVADHFRPVGPRRLTSVRQVALPAALLREVGLGPGEEVYFRLSETEPGTITVLPAAMVEVAAPVGAGRRAMTGRGGARRPAGGVQDRPL
jgi:hypothetical protein